MHFTCNLVDLGWFSTLRNKSLSLVLKSCKSVQETNEEVLFIKTRQLARQINLSRFNKNSRQKLYQLRIMKFRFPGLFFMHIQVICVEFLFSQP